MRTRLLGSLIAVAGLVAACGGGGDGSGRVESAETTTTLAPSTPPYQVAMSEETFADSSRPTPAVEGTGVPAADERTLVTHLYWPEDAEGPQPLIAFAHGAAGHPRKFTELFTAWATAGYVVAAPAFPLSNDEVPGEPGLTDVDQQPDDMRFVVDEVLRLNEEEGSVLEGRVDSERIGAAGLSLGGITIYNWIFSDQDDRVDAAALFDTVRSGIDGATIDLSPDLPKLFIHADEDFALPYADTVEAYAEAAPPKWFVTLHEAAHASPFEDDPDPADTAVTAVSIAFWDLYLREDTTAADRIEDAVAADPAITSLEFEPEPPG